MTACAIEPAAANEESGENGENGGGGTSRTERVSAEDGDTPRTELAITGDGQGAGMELAVTGDGQGAGMELAVTGDGQGSRTQLAITGNSQRPLTDHVIIEDGRIPRAACVITVDGSYAARLALAGNCWFPERWTLDGPEPYAVPLPGNQPEEPGTEVQPMGDGRVLIRRFADGRHTFSLLYPTGPRTGELPLGAVECPDEGTVLRLLPPAPGGEKAYALAVGPRSSAVWLVAGGAFGPEHLAQIPGRCSGGVWLDRARRMLALDRETDGRTKAVVVDLERGGEVSPLLQIADGSDDRLLLADPDSGLLLISSDAPSPGRPRLGWGVLGSTLPVRFPECLRVPDCALTPFAIQPGQVLVPESCGVALRVDGPMGNWVGVWHPAARQVQHLPAPEGWLVGAGLWTEGGELLLPYATADTPCGVARWAAASGNGALAGEAEGPGGTGATEAGGARAWDADPEGSEGGGGKVAGAPEPDPPGPPEPVVARPVPLQQAPLGAPLGNLVTK